MIEIVGIIVGKHVDSAYLTKGTTSAIKGQGEPLNLS